MKYIVTKNIRGFNYYLGLNIVGTGYTWKGLIDHAERLDEEDAKRLANKLNDIESPTFVKKLPNK